MLYDIKWIELGLRYYQINGKNIDRVILANTP